MAISSEHLSRGGHWRYTCVSVGLFASGINHMQIGVYFPQYELPPQADAVRDYVQGVEALGFNHLIIMDHVVGANKASRPEWSATYHLETIFHEPFALIAFL